MIYIDLDGVCADFNKACLEITGKPYSGKETWEVLENIDNLFYNLEVLPNAKESVTELVYNFGFHNVQILTALPLTTGKLTSAQVDKVQWVHENINRTLQVNCVQNWRHKKYFVRSKYDILIDDSERNCKEWTEAGGRAIVHVSWEDTLKKLIIE